MKKISSAILAAVALAAFGFVSCDHDYSNSDIQAGVVSYALTPKHTVTFDANGGTIKTATAVLAEDKRDNLPTAEDLGLKAPDSKTFLGWAEEADATAKKFSDGEEKFSITKDITLYAVYKSESTAIPESATYDFKDVTEAEVKALGATGLTDSSTALSDGTVLGGKVSIVSGSKFKLKTDSNKGIVTGIIIGTNTFTGDTTTAVVNAGLETGSVVNIEKYIEYKAPSTGTYDLELAYAMNAASGGAVDAKYYIVVVDEDGKILAHKLYATGDYEAATELKETFSGLSLTKDQKVRVTFLRGASKGGLIVNSLAFNAK